MSKIKYVGETALNALVAKIKSITGTITGVMRFVGSLKELPKDNSSYMKGDVILVGTKEYVLNETDGNKVWVEIGDEGLWLSKNDIITNFVLVDEKTTNVTLATIANSSISLKFDFSNFVTSSKLTTAINGVISNVQNLLKNMVTNDKLDAYIKKEDVILHNNSDEIFLPKNNDKIISKNILTIGNKSVVVTIDFNDIYSQIDNINQTIIRANIVRRDFFEQNFKFTDSNRSINQKYLMEGAREVTTIIDLSDVYSKIDEIKNQYVKKDSTNVFTDPYLIKLDGDKPIDLVLNGVTQIATFNSNEPGNSVTLNTEKFVSDLKAEFINTGFVHDDSGTKTTFEEITYEEVENLFK